MFSFSAILWASAQDMVCPVIFSLMAAAMISSSLRHGIVMKSAPSSLPKLSASFFVMTLEVRTTLSLFIDSLRSYPTAVNPPST